MGMSSSQLTIIFFRGVETTFFKPHRFDELPVRLPGSRRQVHLLRVAEGTWKCRPSTCISTCNSTGHGRRGGAYRDRRSSASSAVFKDVFSKDWQQLLRGPVTLLRSLLTSLQPCPDAGCDGSCKFFHAACDEEVSNPVLDVWSWRWTNVDNKQVPVDQSTVFSVFFRVPHSALKSVLSVSGWFGIFLEPRPANKQGPHPAFAVVWLPESFELENIH